jgi:hypothetical protein
MFYEYDNKEQAEHTVLIDDVVVFVTQHIIIFYWYSISTQW